MNQVIGALYIRYIVSLQENNKRRHSYTHTRYIVDSHNAPKRMINATNKHLPNIISYIWESTGTPSRKFCDIRMTSRNVYRISKGGLSP